MFCLKCEISESDQTVLLNCDSCNRFIHKKCSGLNASEMKVMELRGKRSLKFLCGECSQGLLQVPNILKAMDELKFEIQQLKQNCSLPIIDDLKSDIQQLKLEQTACTKTGGTKEIIDELNDRQKREKNLMIFNMPNRNNDVESVKELLTKILSDPIIPTNIHRIGKSNRNGSKPVKVTLPSQADVLNVLKNKHKLKGHDVYIAADLTKKQREQEISVSMELKNRVKEGEKDLYIKYVQGTPKICSRNSSKN